MLFRRHFHVVVVQWRQRNEQKSVMHEQSLCFTLNLFFLPFSSLTPSSLPKLPISQVRSVSFYFSLSPLSYLDDPMSGIPEVH